MLKISITVVLSFMYVNLVHADSIFTAIVGKNTEEAFVALKDESGKKPSPVIYTLNKSNLKKTKLSISKDIKSREIAAMYYHHDILYIVSQWTIGTGDKPKLHSFDFKTKKWKSLGVFNCLTISKLEFENKKVTLICDKDNQSSIEISTLQVSYPKTIYLPQGSSDFSNHGKLTLEGLKYYWRTMKSSGGENKKIQILSASEFF